MLKLYFLFPVSFCCSSVNFFFFNFLFFASSLSLSLSLFHLFLLYSEEITESIIVKYDGREFLYQLCSRGLIKFCYSLFDFDLTCLQFVCLLMGSCVLFEHLKCTKMDLRLSFDKKCGLYFRIKLFIHIYNIIIIIAFISAVSREPVQSSIHRSLSHV